MVFPQALRLATILLKDLSVSKATRSKNELVLKTTKVFQANCWKEIIWENYPDEKNLKNSKRQPINQNKNALWKISKKNRKICEKTLWKSLPMLYYRPLLWRNIRKLNQCHFDRRNSLLKIHYITRLHDEE